MKTHGFGFQKIFDNLKISDNLKIFDNLRYGLEPTPFNDKHVMNNEH